MTTISSLQEVTMTVDWSKPHQRALFLF